MMRLIAAVTSALVLAGCASTGGPQPEPTYAQNVGDPAPPRARLYTDCIAQAIAAGRVDRDRDADTTLLRFTCEGAPASAFLAGLEAWSAAIGSEFIHGDRLFRSTTKVRLDLFGVDHCSTDEAGRDVRCVIVLNTGPFLSAQP